MRLEDTMQNGLFILGLLLTIGCSGGTEDDTVDTDTDSGGEPDLQGAGL